MLRHRFLNSCAAELQVKYVGNRHSSRAVVAALQRKAAVALRTRRIGISFATSFAN